MYISVHRTRFNVSGDVLFMTLGQRLAELQSHILTTITKNRTSRKSSLKEGRRIWLPHRAAKTTATPLRSTAGTDGTEENAAAANKTRVTLGKVLTTQELILYVKLELRR